MHQSFEEFVIRLGCAETLLKTHDEMLRDLIERVHELEQQARTSASIRILKD